MNIKLRHFKETDLEDIYDYAKVEGVGEACGWTHHKSIEESQRILNYFIKDELNFAIELDNKVIGSITLHDSWANEVYPNLNIKEIGYVLNKNYWGRGITVICVNKILEYAFIKLNLDAVTACHFNTNNQSRRVIEKTHFKFYQEDIYGPKNILESQYMMTKEEYKKRNT